MGKTSNLALSLLEYTDAKADLPSAWNGNAQTIDNAIGGLQDTVNTLVATGGGSGGNVISIVFEAAFAGAQYTVTGGNETRTGIVPDTLEAKVSVTGCNTTYTITSSVDGVEYSNTVTTGQYYGQYTATLAVFTATINVTAVSGALVTAICGDSSYSTTADGTGVASIAVKKSGTFEVRASKNNASSDTYSLDVTESGATYTAAVNFITLTLSTDAGAAVSIQKDGVILTGTSTGADVFYLPSTGTWTVTVSKDGEDVSGTVNASAYQSYALKLAFISTTLSENTWEKIHEVSAAGEGPNYWAVGDTKSITINGTVGILSLSNLTVDAFIIGMDHNPSVESPGEHRIHWQIGKINGTMVGLCDSGYGSGYTDGTKYFNVNHWGNYNYGGWASCDLRYDILGSTNQAPSGYGAAKTTSLGTSSALDAPADSATNPVSGTLMAALPSDLRAVMQPVIKYTDNVGNHSSSSQGTASDVSATKEYLTPLAEYEVQGARTYANAYEQNYQKQYDYYKAGNSKIAYNHASTSSAVWQRLRSPASSNDNAFCTVHTDGSAGNDRASNAGALLPGFFT